MSHQIQWPKKPWPILELPNKERNKKTITKIKISIVEIEIEKISKYMYKYLIIIIIIIIIYTYALQNGHENSHFIIEVVVFWLINGKWRLFTCHFNTEPQPPNLHSIDPSQPKNMWKGYNQIITYKCFWNSFFNGFIDSINNWIWDQMME